MYVCTSYIQHPPQRTYVRMYVHRPLVNTKTTLLLDKAATTFTKCMHAPQCACLCMHKTARHGEEGRGYDLSLVTRNDATYIPTTSLLPPPHPQRCTAHHQAPPREDIPNRSPNPVPSQLMAVRPVFADPCDGAVSLPDLLDAGS
jgi:hypothetical protein